MRSRDYRPFIEDIRQSCERVLIYSSGLSKEEFFADEKTHDATVCHLIIIGEAVKQIPDEVRMKYPAIECAKNCTLPRLCHSPLFCCEQRHSLEYR